MSETIVTGPWFERATFTAERADPELPPDVAAVVDDYRRDGFIRRDFGFEPDLIDAAAEATRRLHGEFRRVHDLWRRSEPVKRLARHPNVVSFLSALYQRRAFPFQTLNFPVGSEQPAHSDTYHFNSFPQRFMCGVWVALEDVDMNNGPLHYYPGSHRAPVFTRGEVAAQGYGDDYSAFAQAVVERGGYEKRFGVVAKGEAIVWAANLFHGGEAIAEPGRTRLSQVNHYYFDDCLYYTPLASDPEIGRIAMRWPYDISRGRFATPRYQGRRVALDWRVRLRALARMTLLPPLSVPVGRPARGGR